MATAENTLSEPQREESAPSAKKSRARPYLVFAIVVAAVLLAYFAFRLLTAGHESTDDAQVGADMVPISARVGGNVVAVPVVDNQSVKRGDLLAQMDPADYDNKVKVAQAELDAATAEAANADAQMRIVEAGSKGGLSTARAALSGSTSSVAGADAQVEAAKAAVTRAQADAQKADTDLARAMSLRKDDAIPQAQVDSLNAAAAAQHAAVAQAQAQLGVATEMKRTAESRIAEAQGRVEQSTPVEAQLAAAKANADLAHARVASAQASLAQAQLNLSYTKIFAPEDGHISKLAVHPGQLVSPSQTITNVLPDATYVIANFKETQVGAMRPGQSAEVAVDAFRPHLPREGRERLLRHRRAVLAFAAGQRVGKLRSVVQRVPVKLILTDLPDDVRVRPASLLDVTVSLR